MPNFRPFWSSLETPATSSPRLLFADSTDPRVIDAVKILKTKKNAIPVLVEAAVPGEDTLEKGISLLLEGQADGLIAGSLRPTADIVRSAIKRIGPKPGNRFVTGHFLIEPSSHPTSDQTPFIFADCAVMPEPSSRALAIIAMQAAQSYRFFTGKEPKVALLSFSTRDSAQHPLVDRIKEALEIVRKQEPNLLVDGEMQVDAALDSQVAFIKKANDSSVAGRANVFVFPTLEAGNIGYKLTQRFSDARAAGPFLWGLAKPVSDLSRGCSVQEIVDTALCVAKMARELK